MTTSNLCICLRLVVQTDDEVKVFKAKFAGSRGADREKIEAEAKKMAEKLKKTHISESEKLIPINFFIISFCWTMFR